MAATAIVRLYGEVTGLGNDNKISCYALLSDTPTQVSGPVIQALTTTASQLDLISLTSGQPVMVIIKALDGGVYVNPVSSSGLVSECLYIPEGQANLYTYGTSISALPYLQAASSTVNVEYLVVGVT